MVYHEPPAVAPRIAVQTRNGTTRQGEFRGNALEWTLAAAIRRLCRKVALFRQKPIIGFEKSTICDLKLFCFRQFAAEPYREPPACIRYRHACVPGGVLPIEPFCHMQCTAYWGV
jgi:hypothetical protein